MVANPLLIAGPHKLVSLEFTRYQNCPAKWAPLTLVSSPLFSLTCTSLSPAPSVCKCVFLSIYIYIYKWPTLIFICLSLSLSLSWSVSVPVEPHLTLMLLLSLSLYLLFSKYGKSLGCHEVEHSPKRKRFCCRGSFCNCPSENCSLCF